MIIKCKECKKEFEPINYELHCKECNAKFLDRIHDLILNYREEE